jgi:hypothetical protein
MKSTGTKIPADQTRYPKNDGILIPFAVEIDLIIKFGAFPI